jgi:hypothetical protein
LGTGAFFDAMLKKPPLNAHALYFIQPAAFDEEIRRKYCTLCNMYDAKHGHKPVNFRKVMLSYSVEKSSKT